MNGHCAGDYIQPRGGWLFKTAHASRALECPEPDRPIRAVLHQLSHVMQTTCRDTLMRPIVYSGIVNPELSPPAFA
jgi:hypothetical protein